MVKVVVLGAGAMGLAAAHRAAVLGHDVDLVEADRVAGGMAAHFDFGGLSIERFYHFLCRSDEPTFALMRELGIADRIRWAPASMGYYTGGGLHPWGGAVSLLRFPALSFIDKLRTGLQMFQATRAASFDPIEHLTAREWLERGSGKAAYHVLWERLMELKFHEFADQVSASWMATRVRRMGRSRGAGGGTELGYIEGGSQALVDALVQAFTRLGGRLHLATGARRVQVSAGKVTGVETAQGVIAADAVVSTVPAPLVPLLVPDLPEDHKQRYAAIRNIGVACIVLKLKRPVSPHFWVNVAEAGIDIPGFIEFSNLRPMGVPIVYVPYYMPTAHPKWQWPDSELIAEAYGALRRVNPSLKETDLIAGQASRLRYAQPICEPGFRDRLPPIRTPVGGFMAADTCFYYPEDRGIAESVRYGRMMAEMIGR